MTPGGGGPADAGPRFAIYWAPPETSALWRAGAAWLGRDPAGGVIAARPDVAEEVTRAAALYGFHATLKPPMRLRAGVAADDLLAAARAVAAAVPAFDLPPLGVASLGGFLCLRETRERMALQACCDAFVAGLDDLRAPLSAAEQARRHASAATDGGLDPAREANLARWGYPDVFATWTFHMTLTRRLSADETARLTPLAKDWFAAALREPVRVRDICVFVQATPGAAFTLQTRVPLGGRGDG